MQDSLKIGDSIACNGICLTVIEFNNDCVTVEAMHETLIKTTAGYWSVNNSLHLEKAMLLSERLDGHIVQGHVDTTSQLLHKHNIENTLYLTFNLPEKFSSLLVDQGSIAIDGVSLTISRLEDSNFTVSLISHTIKETHFAQLKTGDYVNLEFDIIGKYVNRILNKKAPLDLNWLKENGF